MFRPLKNFYFLSSKYYIVNNRWQKPLRIIRSFSPTNNLSPQSKAIRLLVNHDEPDWEEILQLIKSQGAGGKAEMFILNVCGENRLGKQLLSFLKFLLKNDNLSNLSLKKFLHIVKSEKYYQPCYPVVYTLLKKYITVDVSIAEVCVIVLLGSPVYFDSVFKICQKNIHLFNNGKEILLYLIKINKLEEALKLYTLSHIQIGVEDFLLKYLEEELKNDRISIKLTEFISHVIRRSFQNNQLSLLHPHLSNIMNLINKKEKDYRWSMIIKPFIIDKCPNCRKKLETASMTDDEMKFLMSTLENTVVSQYLSISSFYQKWFNFKKFLNDVNYNVVVDGLNMLHRIAFNAESIQNIIDSFQENKRIPLFISRRHTKSTLSKYVQNFGSVYYTDDIEFDDIYILYAALRCGKGCFILTMDNYGFFSNTIGNKNTVTFEKWKETHFLQFFHKGEIFWPNNIKVGVHEEHCDDPSEFKCHIIQYTQMYDRFYCIQRVRLKK